jgi:hypothetical protein
MESQSLRRSDRVSLTLLLEASGLDMHGQEFQVPAKTMLINRGGAVIVLERELAPEQQILIQRKTPAEAHRQSPVRIVRQIGRERDGYLYGIEILEMGKDLWGVEFPEIPESTDAVAKMLLECSYCNAREVVHLNELELRAFEINRGIARHCKSCRVPSIWTQASNEVEQKVRSSGNRGRRAKEVPGSVPDEGEQRERRRIRLHTRLTACIRQTGTDDELAVCEDISPIGMCFRSKRRYDADTPIDVAVPYSPEAANIFLPARIVYSEEIPKAGLFRHGTEYRRVGPRAR